MPEDQAGDPGSQETRRAARQERRERAERRYKLLEQARQERHQRVRDAVRDTTRFPALGSRRTLVALLVVVIAVIVVIALRNDSSSGPALAKSCTTPAVALSSSSTGSGRGIDYAITGPASGEYVITVDATSVTVQGDKVTVSPQAGFAVAARRGLPKCGASGTLPKLSAGPHQVQLFRDGALAAKATLR